MTRKRRVEQYPRFTALELENYRGFGTRQRIRLAPLTFVVGPNSSGKSSVLASLLFAAQNGLGDPQLDEIHWQGPLIDLGSYQDTVFRHRRTSRIFLAVEMMISPEPAASALSKEQSLQTLDMRIEAEISHSKTDDRDRFSRVLFQPLRQGQLGIMFSTDPAGVVTTWSHQPGASPLSSELNKTTLHSEEGDYFSINAEIKEALNLMAVLVSPKDFTDLASWVKLNRTIRRSSPLTGMQRVASGRGGPARWYSLDESKRSGTVSSHRGRVFDSVDPLMIAEARRAGPPRKGRRALSPVEKYLKTLGIGDRVRRTQISSYHTAIKVHDHITDTTSNLLEIGFGASLVLPVLIAASMDVRGPLVLEQPELHLHPAAQSELSAMLCDVARHRQVLVETHSEHLINRARILVAKGDLQPEDVNIVFVSRDSKGSHAIDIAIDEAGQFSEPWPGGFFDERYVEMLELMNAKRVAENASPSRRDVGASE